MYKIYITDHEHDYSQIEEKILEKESAVVIGAQCRNEQEVMDIAGEADGMLVAYAPITKNVIAELKRCKVIVKYGVGYDNIDVPAATQKGIFVANVPDYCIEEVATHTIALILCCARRIVQYDRLTRDNQWSSMIAGQIERISKQKLGILGFGRIGRKVAMMAKHLGFTIIAHDPYILSETMKKYDVQSVDLETIFSESDYISTHLLLNDQTRHFVNDDALSMMKKSAFLINTSRGSVVNQKALTEALKNKKIAGAALDTFEVEPLDSQNPILKMKNVVLSPHAAWYSEEANKELRSKAAEEIVRVLRGGIPRNLINKELR